MKRCEVGGRLRGEDAPCARAIGQPVQGLFVMMAVLIAAAVPALGAQVRVPQGQMVRVKVHSVITTENVEKDDSIDFDVADDVMVGNHVVIAKGSPARGKVLRVKGAGKKKAKDASVTFRFMSVRAVDNTDIPLRVRPTKGKKSESKENEVEVNSPIPGLTERMVGADRGREFACYTDSDVIVNAPETPAAAAAPSTGAQPAAQMPQTGPAAAPPPTAPSSTLSGLGPGTEPASVDFSSDPTGADILIDGSFVGNTPSTLRVAPGRHVIELRLGGYRSWTRTMTVEPSSHPTIRASLDKE